jgi:lipid II:glycine glycyltransferase (peptidoglycan interpeptide bridge formation enzyme)
MSLLLVKYKSRYISSAILLKYKNCIYYEYSASDPGFLKLHPNHFILWEAIKLAHQEEYSYFYFGRSSIDNRNLIDFKRRWGTEEKALYYYYFPYAQSISAESRESLRFRLTKSVCKKMPIKLLQTFGDITYKYLL